MALLTVEGVFRDGKVELTESPPGVDGEARVLVTFLTLAAAETFLSPEEREILRQRAFARMEKGIPLGGPPYPTRDELSR